MTRVKVGASLLAVGVLGTIANYSARELFPTHWGGPNIGGGIIQLALWGLIGIGLLVLVVNLFRRDNGS